MFKRFVEYYIQQYMKYFKNKMQSCNRELRKKQYKVWKILILIQRIVKKKTVEYFQNMCSNGLIFET